MSTTFHYGGSTYNAIYIDISAGTNGDGLTPATPFNVYPSSIATGDAWILRRTAYNAAKVIPSISSAAASFIIIGCPRTAEQSPFGVKDQFYDIVPAEVITAWGSDSALWAYFTSSGNKITLSSCYALALNGIKMQRTAGTSAGTDTSISNFLINIQQANGSATYSNLHTELYIGGCSFGRAGENVDCDGTDSFGRLHENNATAFTTQIANDGLFNYVAVRDCAQACIENSIINYGAGSSTGGYAIRLYAVWKLTIANVVVNKVTGCDDVGTFWINESNEHKMLSMNVINYTEHILVNGTATSCSHIPSTIYGGASNCPIDYLVMRNVTVDMPRVLGSPNRTGTNLYIYNGIFRFSECSFVRYCDIQDLNLNFNKVWYYMNQNGMPFRIAVCSSTGQVSGAIRKFKNITIQMGEDPAVAYGSNNYANNDGTSSYYNVFFLDGNNTDIGGTYQGGCPITVDNITINNERGKAAYISGAQITNAVFKGQTWFGDMTKADVTSVSSWYPGSFLSFGRGCTIHIGTVTANVANGYNGSQCCLWNTNYGSTLIVDSCNTILSVDNKSTVESYANYDYLMVCKSAMTSAGNTNYFMADSMNQYARSSNIYRTGGSAASIMFINQYADNVTPMILGKSPLLGPQVTISAAGRYKLTYYIAAKGYTNLTAQGTVNNYVGTRFRIKARVPQNADGDNYVDHYSTVCGVYSTDATSTWNNETGLTQWRIDMYIDCPVAKPVAVEFEFNWYGASGCKFLLDPKHELTSL